MNWEACRKLSLQELLLKLLLVPKMPQQRSSSGFNFLIFVVEGHCQPVGECKKNYIGRFDTLYSEDSCYTDDIGEPK